MKTIPAKSILIRNKTTSWFGADYNMNLYRGCSHGCIYCDSRSDCYHIDDFETVVCKENALQLLRDQLAKKARTGMVATGAMSDPYNPFEKETLLTRHALELLGAYGFGVAIATKSALICRDIDILKEIAVHNPVLCKITITTPSDPLAAQIEPHVASSSKRLEAVQKLSSAGIFTGVLLMPVLPWISDKEADILTLVDQVSQAGGRFIYPSFGLTLRAGQREYFYEQLNRQFPDQKLSEKYRKAYGDRYFCSSPQAKTLWKAFTQRCQKYGILYEMPEIIRAYRQGYQTQQLSFY